MAWENVARRFEKLWAMFCFSMGNVFCGYGQQNLEPLRKDFLLTGEKYFPNWKKISRQVPLPDGYVLCIHSS
ncbi:MAG: hypothetical protein PUC85_13615 [bacterium]|nr:hypothetical protein [bacterium]